MKITKVFFPSCKLAMDHQVFMVDIQDSLMEQCENGSQNIRFWKEITFKLWNMRQQKKIRNRTCIKF
jgi:hypothetical protein